MERQLCPQHALLRGVHELRAGRRARGTGQVARVPRAEQLSPGSELHRGPVHRGELLAAFHRGHIRRWPWTIGAILFLHSYSALQVLLPRQ